MSEALLEELIAAGTPARLIAKVAALAAQVEQLHKRRAADAKRQRDWQARRLTSSNVTHVSNRDLTPQHIEDPPLEREKVKKPSLSRATKGTRLPEGWQPTEADLLYAERYHFDLNGRIKLEEDFRDYWHARAGPGGVKNDWAATWRRWVRTAAERRGTPMNGAAKSHLVESGTMIHDETPQAEAWSKHLGKRLVFGRSGVVTMPSEWPPEAKQ